MSDHEVQWTMPAPLWDSVTDLSAETRQTFRRPAIWRFASDTFMDDFMTVLNSQPAQLTDFRAQPETWRGPGSTPHITSIENLPRLAQRLQRARLAAARSAAAATPAPLATSDSSPILKLYQPAHQRYYLIGAALVCRTPGQPDRHIESSQRERVSFVVRKVLPPAGTSIFDSDETTWAEYAFVNGGWQRLSDGHSLAAGEDQQTLFAVSYTPTAGGRRRVLAGLIPVGRREAYLNAPERSAANVIITDPDVPPPPDARTLLFMAQFTEPWKRLVERAFSVQKMQAPEPSALTDDEPLPAAALARSLKDNREQIQTTSWYALLDFAKLLRQYLPKVWQALMGHSVVLTPDEQALLNAITNTTISPAYAVDLVEDSMYSPADVERSLRAAVRAIQGGVPFNQATADAIEKNLDSLVLPYDRDPATNTSSWPGFLFPLADPIQSEPRPPARPGSSESPDPQTAVLDRIDYFTELIAHALPALAAQPVPAPLLAAQPVMRLDATAYFVVRCVFERPNCGPLHPIVMSDPTEPFVMAGFFDPDAPARPIRIALPVDTTPAGLRKFDKNTAFMISDVLCGQIERAKGLGLGDLIRTVLPWPLHKDLDLPDGGPCTDNGVSIGMICSLSIPIITICALIMLMILVNLLDIIFRWVPYFIMCLPFPKLTGKSGT